MELRRLRLLLELSRRGTIGAVADALLYSPSSVSVQLAELEREVGVKLLRRFGRNAQLTPAGWRLVEHAEQALAADEAIVTELSSVEGRPRGRVRVTFVQTPALALLSSALASLAAAAPDLKVEVSQRETAPALEELRSRAVDVVLGIDYDAVPVPRHRDVHRVDLIREQVLLAVPADDALAAPPRRSRWPVSSTPSGLRATSAAVMPRRSSTSATASAATRRTSATARTTR